MSAIVEAVERLAIARGWLGTRGRPYNHDAQPPWTVHMPAGRLTHVTIGNFFEHLGVRVDPLTALLWSLLVGLDTAPVDTGRCSTCDGRGYAFQQFQLIYPDGSNGWDCRGCRGTGRDLRHPARLLLDAASQPYTDDERMMFFGTDPRPVVPLGGCGDPSPGDAETRAHLAVLADMWDSGRAMYTVTVAIPAEWAPHDLGPSLVAVRNDGRVGSIRQTPHGAPVTTTASGPCEMLVTEATTRIEARPLRSQARWLVSWLMDWPGDSSEVCGAEMIEAATKI